MIPFLQTTPLVSDQYRVTPVVQQSHQLDEAKQLDQLDYATHLPPQEGKLSAPSSSNTQCNHVSLGRILLLLFAAVMTITIITSIIFVAHQCYIQFGGQGFLKTRAETQSPTIVDLPGIYLPMRMVETFNDQPDLLSDSTKRSTENVPFYNCGDQQQSCESYGKPNICCPVQMTCHPSRFSTSNVFCCNSTTRESNCRESLMHPPICPPSSNKCSVATGGGCCPQGLICSPNGCIQIKQSSIISSSSSHPITSDPNSVKSLPIVKIDPVTVTEIPASTVTIAKGAEVAQQGDSAKKSLLWTLWVPYASAWVLVCVAALMGMM